MRLQVERDLRAGAMAGENVVGADGVPERRGLDGALDTLGRWVRKTATVAVEIAAAEETGKVLDAATGSSWRWAARAAEVAHVAAKQALAEPASTTADGVAEGEPVSAPGLAPGSPGAPTRDPDRDTTAGSRAG